jgi:hypothetical protein
MDDLGSLDRCISHAARSPPWSEWWFVSRVAGGRLSDVEASEWTSWYKDQNVGMVQGSTLSGVGPHVCPI